MEKIYCKNCRKFAHGKFKAGKCNPFFLNADDGHCDDYKRKWWKFWIREGK